MTDNYLKFLENKRKQLEAATYCCPDMRRMRIEAMGANFHIDWDTKIMTPFGTYESDNYECLPFEMICCMFCGAKL